MSGSDPEIDGLIGATVDAKYRIDGLLGRGGMGAVYQATNVAINKRVALKFLDREAARDAGAVRRFQREAEAASAVESAHIVEIFDSGSAEDGRPFLVMELLRGEDLRSRLRREGRLDLPIALCIATQMLRALARAHRAGIVHRDLKPDNVFLCDRDDHPLFVKIVDFGISKLGTTTVDTLTRRGTVLGTVFYMSPEQAQAVGDIDGRADLYSLGAILFEALSGRPPHTGRVYEAVLVNICTKDADDIRLHAPDVPEPVARVIAKALSRDRDERFRDAEAFLDALLAVAPESLPLFNSQAQRRELDSTVASAPTARELRTLDSNTGQGAAIQTTPARTRPSVRRGLFVFALTSSMAIALAMLLFSGSRSERTHAGATTASAGADLPLAASAEAELGSAVGPSHSEQDTGVPALSTAIAKEPVLERPAPSASVGPSPASSVRTVGRSKPKRPAAPTEERTSGGKTEGSGVLGGLELNTRGP